MLVPVTPTKYKTTPPFLFLCRIDQDDSTHFIPLDKITMVRDNYLFVEGIDQGIYLTNAQLNYFYEMSFDPGEIEDYMEVEEYVKPSEVINGRV